MREHEDEPRDAVDEPGHALVQLGRALRTAGYHFITPTPETLRRVRARARSPDDDQAKNLRDVFGYSRSFSRALLPPELFELLRSAGELRSEGDLFRSNVRFSSLGPDLYVHAAYPTSESDAVFFGPDTYRFCAFLEQVALPARRVVDVGAGSGAGALSLRRRAQRLTLVDINERALRYSAVNAALAGAECEFVQGDVLTGVEGDMDLVIANPPYMRDPAARLYRDGGGTHGEGLSVRIVREALARLSPGGTLILYTGAAIVDGLDTCWSALRPVLACHRLDLSYRELDPDVFGEELSSGSYADTERIAAVGLVARLR